MNIAVLHVNSAGAAATSPTMRIARYVAGHLKVPLIHDIASAHKYRNTKFDYLLVKYGVLKFSNHRDDALRIYGNAARIVNIENDYSFKRDPRFKKLHEEHDLHWSTVKTNTKMFGGSYINWNVLTWLYPRKWKEGVVHAPPPTKASVLYYGAYRPDRVTSFNHFLGPHAPFPITIGARSTHIKKFQALNPEAHVLNFRDPRELQAIGPAIYIEDESSHALFCSLANRFYECLQLGIPQILDASGVGTYATSRILKYEEFQVCNVDDIRHLLRGTSYVKMRDYQQKLWYKDFDAKLHEQVEAARKGLT